jgi:lipopolysaccharide/colanic/teichoic acid biosynthesis glycosyltransferase
MRAKRAMDIVIGSTLALVVTPLVLVLAVGCAVSLRAWPLFVQRRVGRHGREFLLPKLRTLPRETPTEADKYELAGTAIPAFCRLLRRTHLDELPQLFVVPLGWMSLVGPRPEMPGQLGRYPQDFVVERTSIRPGCTGLWQVSKAAQMLIFESPEYDVAYIRHARLRLDAWILFRTLRSCTSGAAALSLDDVPRWAWTRRPEGTAAAPAAVDLVAPERLDAAGQAAPASPLG